MTSPAGIAPPHAPRIDSDRIAVFALAAAVVVPLIVFVVVPLAGIL